MTSLRAPDRTTMTVVLALRLAGCGSGEGAQSPTDANKADRAAQAYERAKALEANAAELEADLARLSGEPSLDPDAPAPQAIAPPKPVEVVKTRPVRPPAPRAPPAATPPASPPHARPKSLTVTAKAGPERAPAKPSVKQAATKAPPSPTAGELQRAIAPGGMLNENAPPQLDYNGMP